MLDVIRLHGGAAALQHAVARSVESWLGLQPAQDGWGPSKRLVIVKKTEIQDLCKSAAIPFAGTGARGDKKETLLEMIGKKLLESAEIRPKRDRSSAAAAAAGASGSKKRQRGVTANK